MIGIVGGLGFIGTRLRSRFESNNTPFVILDRRSTGAKDLPGIRCDVRDQNALTDGLRGCDVVINLAAEHRDDVTPKSLYEEVNVGGARAACAAARTNGIERMVFTSSVAVYGNAAAGTDESGQLAPFNEYGRTKMLAESIYREWLAEAPTRRSLTIVRPTVVFGERNRGNVYNLIKQADTGLFVMIGSGRNRKSMAYVENVAAFLQHSLGFGPGEHLFNYVDKPDFDMNSLVREIRMALGRSGSRLLRIPQWVGLAGGAAFDAVAWLLRRKLSISSIRVRKFCAETQFESAASKVPGFTPEVDLGAGLSRTIRHDFLEEHDDDLFYSE